MIRLNTLIPTFILEKGEKVEDVKDQETFYIVAANGCFLKQKQDLFAAISRVTAIPGLAEVKEFTDSYVPRIPLGLLNTVTRFFEEIYKKYKSEAVVVLHFNLATKQWIIDVPEQEVASASADYDRKTNRRIDNFIRIGTIHSHASMGAFHSGVDDKDEENFDGVHITIGNLDQDEKSYSARLMCIGKSIKLEPINLLSDEPFEMAEIPKEWIDKVKERYATTGFYDNEFYSRRYGGESLYDDEFYYGEAGFGGRSVTTYPRREPTMQQELDLKQCGRKRSRVISKAKAKGKFRSFVDKFKGGGKSSLPTILPKQEPPTQLKDKGEIL